MHFLTPIWFLALAAVSIPVVIHLWNIREGKTLKVGSIALFEESSRRSSRSFNLLDILLLILRCVFLALLALLLALPFYNRQVKIRKAKGWVLIPREIFSETYQHYKPSVDSMLKAGFEFHFFNDSLPQADLTKLLTSHPTIGQIDSGVKQPSNYWSLLKRLDTKVDGSLPVYLFTENKLSHFGGEKPEVALNLHWQTFIPADSVSTWISSAYFTNNNNIRVIAGTSKPGGTTYNYYTIRSDGANSPVAVTVNNGQPFVTLKNSKAAGVAVDTSVIRIAIFTDSYPQDAAYLKAALQSNLQFMQHKSSIRQYNNGEAIPAGQQWLFWLSDSSIPETTRKKAGNTFSYKMGKAVSDNSWIATEQAYGLPGGNAKVALYKRITAQLTGEPVWRDGFGQAILTLQKEAKGNDYQFYSRFNPSWSDLVWSDQFPQLLLQLLLKDDSNTATEDRRAIDLEQIQPLHEVSKDAIANKFIAQVNLSHYCWIALLIVFGIERWLASKNKLILQNG